jgi:lipoprotein-anchoring transpeptidase ErfK/SrfK
VFFTGGYAVHGTYEVRHLGQPASHGCVRLETRNAATFFSMTADVGLSNTRIVISE